MATLVGGIVTAADDQKADDVLVSGATGLIGRRLVPALERRFSTVRVLSRSPASEQTNRRHFVWDGVDPDREALVGSAAVVHLAGEPIFGGLPTAARRERIRRSRIDSTRALVEAIASLDPARRPRTLVCASAVGYFGDRGEEVLDEASQPGSGFLAEVCRDWEAEAEGATAVGLRVVRIRIGVVLSKDGGALSLMRVPFSLGIGGRLGDGRQFFPWIHLDDLVGVILWALESPVAGAINAVAPESIRNAELTRALGRVLHRPALLPVPGFALRLALGELAGELLGSRRVRPARLEEAGFVFRHRTLESALEAELG
jgi:uncharacterized protein (TIGR01777 family)